MSPPPFKGALYDSIKPNNNNLSLLESIGAARLKANQGSINGGELTSLLQATAKSLRDALGTDERYAGNIKGLENVSGIFVDRTAIPMYKVSAVGTAKGLTELLQGSLAQANDVDSTPKGRLLEELGALHGLLQKCGNILFMHPAARPSDKDFKVEPDDTTRTCWDAMKRALKL